MLSESYFELRDDLHREFGIEEETEKEVIDWSEYKIETENDFSDLITEFREDSENATTELNGFEHSHKRISFYKKVPKGVDGIQALALEKDRLSELSKQLKAAAHYLEWTSHASVGFILRNFKSELKADEHIKVSMVIENLSKRIEALKSESKGQAHWQHKSDYRAEQQSEIVFLTEARKILYRFNQAIYEIKTA